MGQKAVLSMTKPIKKRVCSGRQKIRAEQGRTEQAQPEPRLVGDHGSNLRHCPRSGPLGGAGLAVPLLSFFPILPNSSFLLPSAGLPRF